MLVIRVMAEGLKDDGVEVGHQCAIPAGGPIVGGGPWPVNHGKEAGLQHQPGNAAVALQRVPAKGQKCREMQRNVEKCREMQRNA